MAEDDQKKEGPSGGEDSGEKEKAEVYHCPSCGGEIDIVGLAPFSKVACPHCDESVRVRTLLGNYQIQRMLGEGGMSQVFLAEDLALNRQVALKILHQELSRDEALMALFEREAKLTASIHHPNVVKVYTVGSDGEYFYIAMELVDNVSLEERIQDQGLIPEREALDLLHDVAAGLRTAFQGGLIHRDIKPGNILLTKDGTGKLVDFGLAVQQGGDDEVEDLWATPFYVPPEKLDGKPDDFRGDVYSLGATFFHALAGRPPFDANTASLEELREIKSKPVSLLHTGAPVSAVTARLIDQMMAYKPEARPKSYEALLAAIEEAQARLPGGTASRARRQSALGGGREGLSWPVKIGIGGGSVAVIGLVIAMIVGNGGGRFDDAELPESFVNEGGDRVLSAGEKAVAARYNEARSLLLEGRPGAASKAFAALLESGDLKQPTLGWTQYHAGIAALLNGESPAKARQYFTEMAKAPGFEETEEPLAAQGAFFRKAGQVLADPLPVMPNAEAGLAKGTFERFALLAYGLKNWNQAQFGSAMEFLSAFSESDFSQGFAWMDAYRGLVEPYAADAGKVANLPKPSIAMSEGDLEALRSQLEAALKGLRTKGGARELAQDRLARIDELIEAKKALAAAPPEPEPQPGEIPPKMAANDDGSPDQATSVFLNPEQMAPAPVVPPGDGADGEPEWTPEAVAERARLAETIAAVADDAKNYRFEVVRDTVAAFEPGTAAVGQVREDYLAALDGAMAFRDRLIERLSAGDYEGRLLRKEGLPIDCKVVGAEPDKLVVDLMFGPNDLPIADVAPGWMLSVGRESWLPETPDETASDDWAEAAWFARQSGLETEAEMLAQSVAPLSETFAKRWARLSELP